MCTMLIYYLDSKYNMVELKEGWTNFRIVESLDGSFTGNITHESRTKFTDEDRKYLAAYTRQYLKEKLGYTITDQWGKILE